MRFPWHWFRSEHGPRKGAFVTLSGDIVKFNYDYAGMDTARHVPMLSVIAICNAIPANGDRWSAEWQAAPVDDELPIFQEALSWAGDDAPLFLNYFISTRQTTNGNEGFAQLKDCVKQAQEDRKVWLEKELNALSDPHALLERELITFDWTSHFSDDHSYWMAGESAAKRVKILVNHCDKDRVQELWKKYAPDEMPNPYN